jgi:drug/metabolite transporter (DMT)-like permease
MPSRSVLTAAVLGLFALWANSFVAIGFLLGAEKSAPRFDFVGLTAARFGTVGVASALWLLARRRRETFELLRAHGGWIAVSGLLNVVVYNFALNYGQASGVPAPIASLTTALAPLFLVVLGAVVLGEELPRRRVIGFFVALVGLVMVGAARGAFSPGAARYGLSLLVVVLAPASFAIYTVLSRPALVGGRGKRPVDPVTWTLAIFAVGGLPLAALLPWRGGRDLLALDLPGWAALGFLSILCTIVGFFVWVRLLRVLPASVVGLTIFLNPPMTTLSKAILAATFPATFQFTIKPLEWVGGAVLLAGVAFALLSPTRKAARETEAVSPAAAAG